MEPGGRSRVTIIDVAQAAGVSKSTVSLVLQGSPLVRPATQEEVRPTIRGLGYLHNAGAAGARAGAVVPDNRRGAREAVEHLAGLGHRRIAFAGGFTDALVHEERIAGYRDALAAAGLPADEALVIEVPPNRDGGIAAVPRCLELGEPPTAVMCFNDAVGLGVCLALKQRGLEPRLDVALLGFGDIAEARHPT